MISLKTHFTRAAFGFPRSDTFWLLIWILFILDEEQRREEMRRKKAQRPSGPRPF